MADTFAYDILVTFVVAAIFCIASVSECLSHEGFSIELVHRDSPRSPFYNPSETSSQRLINAVSRSAQLSNHLLNSFAPNDEGIPVSTILSIKGEYVINISIGTPPFKIVAIADTGSDLIWTQCKPCTQCFEQIYPIFDPRKSPTFRKLSCTTRACQGISTAASCDDKRLCNYQYNYADGSYTRGNIAIDTVSLDTTSGKLVSFPKTVFGCGYDNDGTFNNQTSGIIGLGGGPVSLISQMGNATGGIFSYCLVPFSETESSSKLHFGANAKVSGEDVITTPLVPNKLGTFYTVTLEGASVGKTRIPINNSSLSTKGNMVVDSGTTLTLLPQDLFDKLQSEIVKQVELEQIPDPQGFLSLCFSSSSDRASLPTITLHFDGADLKLASDNAFLRLTDDILCFSMNPNPRLTILGNLAQTNFEVGYDIANSKLSFKPTDCTKQ